MDFVIYCKQNDEPTIPLTVRVEWLPDGTIAPLCYWTPDGTCCEIISQSERVGIAYLKNGGEGVRYKVCAKIVDAPDQNTDAIGTRFDSYLYLADARFSQRNIIDARYGHGSKEYIAVTLDLFPDGDYELVYFTVRRQRYKVEKILSLEQRGSFKAGGIGLCHTVDARAVNAENDEDADAQPCTRRRAAVYWELNKWFVLQ